MADLLGILEKIVKLALTIKEAVNTVRHNKDECQQIRARAVRVSSLLSRLPETGMTADPAMCGALEDLEDSLRRAHELVAACQEGTTVCLYCTARRQAGRLRRAQDDISQKVMLVIFATNIQTTIILTNIRVADAAAPPPPPPPPPRSYSSEELSAPARAYRKRLARRHSAGHFARLEGREDEVRIRRRPEHMAAGHIRIIGLIRKFSLSELEAATHHFSEENMIGSGAFATIYKGVLQDGLVVAIKKFRNPYVLSEDRIDELHRLSKFRHNNIAKLIGYGSEVLETAEKFEDAEFGPKEDKETSVFFVEEYMPNGSLDKIIDGSQLDWSSRFLVIQGIALGLRYLHGRNVAYLDVKPSNILLDSDMNAKITDFGIARVLNQKGIGICSDTGTIAGTLGYMPPEYLTDGTLSNKYDVYGFGVTILEVISGMSRTKGASGQASIAWGWEARQAGRMAELFDTSVVDERQLKEVERCLQVGLLCTQFDPAHRPDMLEVIKMLRGERTLRTPVRPGYTTKGQPSTSRFLPRWSCLRMS